MSLIEKIGPHTISRLANAASHRFAEADYLAKGGHYLASIYLYGYVVEIIIGIAYFRVLGFGSTDPIEDKRLNRARDLARQLSQVSDTSHPIDGWARLLVREKPVLSPPAYVKKMEQDIVDRADLICKHWGPKLRYRAIDASQQQVSDVRGAAEWFLANRIKL